MAESIIDMGEDRSGEENYPSNQERANGLHAKATKLDFTIFILIVNFMLEIPSAVFDQLSSVRKPQYALVSMLMSYLVLLISAVDLVLKGRKARVRLMIKGWIPWFYYPYPNDSKPFGKFFEIMGSVCAILQCIFTSITYSCLSNNEDNPIKLNFWPILFALGLLFSKISTDDSQSSEPSIQSSEDLTPLLRTRNVVTFTLDELTAATNDFSAENRIGFGSFGAVHRGKLQDGREVVIKRRRSRQGEKYDYPCFKDVFDREVLFQLWLSHEKLVGLVGYYRDEDCGLLVFEYMKNGTLSEHLHGERNSEVINAWKMRINIALDAARGIHYLHSKETPLVHRKIDSSSILLDANWNARVSDFALAGWCETDSYPASPASTPEYVPTNLRDKKNDVYNFGIVLLEVLLGKRFKNNGGSVMTELVDYAVSKIIDKEWIRILDRRVGVPKENEAKALELVTCSAVACLNLDERKSKTCTMSEVVANLERSLSLFEGSESTTAQDMGVGTQTSEK